LREQIQRYLPEVVTDYIELAAQSYGAITSAEGRFSVAAMPPGTYTVELAYRFPPGSRQWLHAPYGN